MEPSQLGSVAGPGRPRGSTHVRRRVPRRQVHCNRKLREELQALGSRDVIDDEGGRSTV